MTGDDQAVTLSAIRQSGLWVTRASEHGVIVHGRTLQKLQVSARQALALRCGTSPAPPVHVSPQSPELDALAEMRLRYNKALRDAVQSLHASGATWSDIAHACQIRIADARAVMEQTRCY